MVTSEYRSHWLNRRPALLAVLITLLCATAVLLRLSDIFFTADDCNRLYGGPRCGGTPSRQQMEVVVAGSNHDTTHPRWHREEVNADLTPCSQGQRLQAMRSYCETHDLRRIESKLNPQTLRHFYYSDARKVIYCAVPKAATTTFLAVLAHSSANRSVSQTQEEQFAGKRIHRNSALSISDVGRLSNLNRSQIRHRLDTYWKFMSVRHPFERLRSAWNNCFGNKLFKPNGQLKLVLVKTRMRPFFKERHKEHLLEDTTRGLNITWEAFVHLVAESDFFHNLHWQSYVNRCHPCKVQYDHVVKMETLSADIYDVIRNLPGPYGIASFPHNNQKQAHSSRDKFTRMGDHYGAFSEDIMRLLYKRYQADFDMFGYQWHWKGKEGLCSNTPARDDNSRCC